MPALRLLNVMCRLDLSWMNSILILRLPAFLSGLPPASSEPSDASEPFSWWNGSAAVKRQRQRTGRTASRGEGGGDAPPAAEVPSPTSLAARARFLLDGGAPGLAGSSAGDAGCAGWDGEFANGYGFGFEGCLRKAMIAVLGV